MYFILFSCIKSRYVYKHIFNKFFFYFLAEFVGLNQFFFSLIFSCLYCMSQALCLTAELVVEVVVGEAKYLLGEVGE